jgi:hypothetical protein
MEVPLASFGSHGTPGAVGGATDLKVCNIDGEIALEMTYPRAIKHTIADLRRLIKAEKGLGERDCVSFLYGDEIVDEEVNLKDLWPPLQELTLQMVIAEKDPRTSYPVTAGEIIRTQKVGGDLIVIARQGCLAETHPDSDNIVKEYSLVVKPTRTVVHSHTHAGEVHFRIKDMPDPSNPFQSSVMTLKTKVFHPDPRLFSPLLLGSADVSQPYESAFIRTAMLLSCQLLLDLGGLVCNLLAIIWAFCSESVNVSLPLLATIYVPGFVLSLLGVVMRFNDGGHRENDSVGNVFQISVNYAFLPDLLLLSPMVPDISWCPILLVCLVMMPVWLLIFLVWLLMMVVWFSVATLYLLILPFGAFFYVVVFPCVQISSICCRGNFILGRGRSFQEAYMLFNVVFGDLPRVIICSVVLSQPIVSDESSQALMLCLTCSAMELLLAVLRHRLSIILWALRMISQDQIFSCIFLAGFRCGNHILSLCGILEEYIGPS